jgi:hypothetical protein
MKNDKEKIEMLAERVKLLFGFCADFIPDIEILRETLLGARQKEDFTMSAAPMLGAYGIYFEEKNAEWKLRRERAEALINLIEVLDRTEKQRVKSKEKIADMASVMKLFNL